MWISDFNSNFNSYFNSDFHTIVKFFFFSFFNKKYLSHGFAISHFSGDLNIFTLFLCKFHYFHFYLSSKLPYTLHNHAYEPIMIELFYQ